MKLRPVFPLLVLALIQPVPAQEKQAQDQPMQDQPIRIRTDLVQIDIVISDKNGKVVKGLTKDDFTLTESGKKQQISFFEFVDAEKGAVTVDGDETPGAPGAEHGLSEADVRRIFAFVVDDLTIRYEDLTYIRKMLLNFLHDRMRPTDLVAIIRTVGGSGLLQQFTTDKALLARAVASLTPRPHPLAAFNNPSSDLVASGALADATELGNPALGADAQPEDITNERVGINSPLEESNKTFRAFMALSTAKFVIDSLKEMPGRKSLVLISGGLPILNPQSDSDAGTVSYFLQDLTDKATRSGVAIHTMDVRGLQAMSALASFADTPGKSAMMPPEFSNSRSIDQDPIGAASRFGRGPDERLLGTKNPFDVMEAQMGLRALAAATGGVAVLNKNDFDKGLERILDLSEGYYVLAYTPSDGKFDGNFRKLEVKVRGDYRVYNRKGYIAAEEERAPAPSNEEERLKQQLLAALRSPLARRDVAFDALLLYKPAPPDQGAVDIHLAVDPSRLTFEEVEGQYQTKYDVAVFVFDALGNLRGGTSDTVSATVAPEEMERMKVSGVPYMADTTLPAGIYQVRLAVRDSKSGALGTTSRYLEVPDLSKGGFTASSLLVGAVPANTPSAENPAPISASRRVSRKNDLRYAALIYNPKLKNGKPNVTTQLVISQGGKEVYREPEQAVPPGENASQLIKLGQLILGRVPLGRYTLSLIITDQNGDKKSQVVTRSLDFVVTN